MPIPPPNVALTGLAAELRERARTGNPIRIAAPALVVALVAAAPRASLAQATNVYTTPMYITAPKNTYANHFLASASGVMSSFEAIASFLPQGRHVGHHILHRLLVRQLIF